MKSKAKAKTAELTDILVEYDGPQLLFLKSNRDHNMLAVAVENKDMECPFFSCEIRDKFLERYFDGKADLLFTFRSAIGENYYFFEIFDIFSMYQKIIKKIMPTPPTF